MIPKKIHYFWFGENEKPKSVQKCINSWKKYCPDYEIIEWNKTNFDIHCMPFVEQAYEAKKYAFVSDVARLMVVYEYGGIYMDTDVEVIKPLDDLLENRSYMSFENNENINTGQGFGSESGTEILKFHIAQYENEQPSRFVQLVWCIMLIILPIALVFSESSMNNIQSVSIIAAFPIGIVIIMIVVSFLKDAKNYINDRI